MSTFNDPVTEQDLPGIGRRYQMTDDSGQVITVIVHHSGRRDVYVPRRGSNEVDAVSFTDDLALASPVLAVRPAWLSALLTRTGAMPRSPRPPERTAPPPAHRA